MHLVGACASLAMHRQRFSGSQLPAPKQCPNLNWPLTGEMLALMGPSGSGKSR